MSLIQCEACAGNGEVVTDWGVYLHPPEGAPADAGVKDCPECDGLGWFDDGGSAADEESR